MDDEGQCELEVPLFIELKESTCANNDLGAYSTLQIGADQFIGSFKGKIKKLQSQCGDQTYVWTILSSRQVPLFYIDASDPKDSNWLRFIRSTYDPTKSNIMCMQQNQQINYFTSKEINQGDELLTYLPKKKGKNKNKNFQNRTYKIVDSTTKTAKETLRTTTINTISKIEESSSSSFSTESSKASNEVESSKKTSLKNTDLDDMKPSPSEYDDLTVDLEYIEPNITNRNILTDLNLTIHTKYEKTNKKLRLFKCSLCSFLSSNNINELNCLNELKKHYLRTHLNLNEESFINKYNEIDTQILDVMSTLLFKVENQIKDKSNQLFFKCHLCTDVQDDEDDLREHLLKTHNKNDKLFSCLYCTKEFRKLNFFCNHMKSLHKEEIALTQMITPQTSYLNTTQVDWFKLIDLKLNDDMEFKTNDMDIDDSNSNDSSSGLSSSDKQDKNDDETKTDANEKDDDTIKHKSNNKQNKHMKLNKGESSNSLKTSIVTSSKTWTCQLCKKQFDQRVDLSKHQCIELNLKLLKKKKDIRKKKWREAHWKRKIDLSYIETTSLTQLSQNIADNLSFCIDGTNEDLKAYSREVKDYLNTELGSETQVQMFLKCCFPDVLKKLGAVNSNQFDTNLLNKSNSYFIDCVYNPNKQETTQNHLNNNHHYHKTNKFINSNQLVYNCKTCKFKSHSMPELIQHQREAHKLSFKTTFDCFNNKLDEQEEHEEESNVCVNWASSNMNATSAVGYFGCDPFAYVFNLHWDQTLQIKCSNCNNIFTRPKYLKHVLNCSQQTDDNVLIEIETIRKDQRETLNEMSLVKEEETIDFKVSNESFLIIQNETDTDDLVETTCKQIIRDLISQIELEKNLNEMKCEQLNDISKIVESKLDEKHTKTNLLRISSRLRRSNQKKIENKNLIDKFLNPTSHNTSSSSSASSSDEETSTSNKKIKSSKEDDANTTVVTTNHVIEKLNGINIRKIYECEKCGLEFTSSNSVIRHQEKSCLRVKVISLRSPKNTAGKSGDLMLAKKCPICAATFFNTHRVSIHIYKHHRNLLGSASLPPSTEAKHLNDIQMKKFNCSNSKSSQVNDN